MKAIIVGVSYFKMDYDFEESMRELKDLCKACMVEVVYQVTQSLDVINNATYIGKGKVEELMHLKDEVDLIIFNEELSPTQVKNLSEQLDIEILDRTNLILKIFESRAKTTEAKLQVKIAKLQYMLPRLVGSNEELIGQMGGSGFRGSGEKQIELDRRVISREIIKAKRELQKIVTSRQVQRNLRSRNAQKVVALVGYTNSGKSSLMNYFVNQTNNFKTVLEKDMLFATLETSTRKVKLPNHKPFLLTDTVGFINQLPHHLVQAFRSTLEEVKEADLILNVIDSSSDFYDEHCKVTESILNELGVEQNKMIYVYNKIDLNKYAFIKPKEPNVFISIKNNINIEKLNSLINQYLFGDDTIVEIILPYHQMSLLSYLIENSYVHFYDFHDEGIYVKVECSPFIKSKIKDYLLLN